MIPCAKNDLTNVDQKQLIPRYHHYCSGVTSTHNRSDVGRELTTHEHVDVAEEDSQEEVEHHELPQSNTSHKEQGIPVRPATPDAVVHDLVPGKTHGETKERGSGITTSASVCLVVADSFR